jgi:hypothetical protein
VAVFDEITSGALSDRPYDDAARMRLTDEYSYLGVQTFDRLAASARVVVSGVVTSIGRPSLQLLRRRLLGPALHDEPDVADIAAELFRDGHSNGD